MKDYTYFQPKSIPIASLLVVHGMAEHQGRYAEFAQFLADHDIAVMTFDHLGHGQQAKDTDTLGFMGNPEPNENMLTHVMNHADRLASEYPDIPQFILGHSMGSFITRCLLGRYGKMFDGAIIMGTSATNPLNTLAVPLTQRLNSLASHRTNPVLDKLLNKLNNFPFRHEQDLQGFNWLNSDANAVKTYLADPLCGFPFTNNGYAALMTLMAEGTGKHWADDIPTTLPLLFVSGKDDPIGQMGKGIPTIVNDLKHRHFTHITVKQYPMMRHEILQELERQQVYDDILTWLTDLIEQNDYDDKNI